MRRKLLQASGIPITVHPADVDERRVEESATAQAPTALALMLAREKALAVGRLNPGRLVLGADQILSLGTRRFAKPTDRAGAREQLRALSGRTHELHSAVVFAQDAQAVFEHAAVARLTMRSFSERFLDLYLDAVAGAATASVGAYQFEGLGIQLFERLDGDYFVVLGLPLIPALDFLRRKGWLER